MSQKICNVDGAGNMVTVMVQSDNNGDGRGVVKVVAYMVFMHCSDE